MKVLVLTTSFPLVKGSNSGIFLKKLIDNLPDHIDATVLTPDCQVKDTSEQYSYKVVRYRYAPKQWQQLAHGSGGIVAALSKKSFTCLLIPTLLVSCLLTSLWYALKADVLHANWSVNGVVAGVAGLLTGKPVVTTLRGSDVNLIRASRVMRVVVHLCLCLSNVIVTVSPSLKIALEEEFPNYYNKIHCISNGIDDDFFVNRSRSYRERQNVRFLYIGNLTEGKGVYLILMALTLLKSVNWSLDIVGDGPDRKKLNEYCRCNGLDAKVLFHGVVAHKDIPQLLQNSDAFIFASFFEGRPNVVLEAMAAGLPIVASGIPSVLDLIEDGKTGLIFPAGNEKILKEHLDYIISHPEKRIEMGNQAREFIASQELSWQKAAEQYADIYNRALT